MGRLWSSPLSQGTLIFATRRPHTIVDGNILPISAEEYPMSDDQVWFDPDISKAAIALRQVFDDEVLRQKCSSAAQIFVSERYGLEDVASAQRRRFIELGFGVE